MTTHVKFDTRPWLASNKGGPRGYGSWAFMVEGSNEVVLTHAMTYAEAKRWMTARVRQDSATRYLQVVYVDVLP